MYRVAYFAQIKSTAYLRQLRRKEKETLERFDVEAETPIRTFYDGPLFDPLGVRAGLEPQRGIPACGLHPGDNPIPEQQVSGKRLRFTVGVSRSYFGDALRIVDAPDEARADPRFNPFGWSAEPMTDGLALVASGLSGTMELSFEEAAVDGFIGFRLNHCAGLEGENARLTTPDGYSLAARCNTVSDCSKRSHGRLELATGRIYNFHYNVRFYNSALVSLLSVNPDLIPPPLLFPGVPQGGHAIGHLEFRNGRLTLSVHALMFLPLGVKTKDTPIRMPPSDSGGKYAKAFPARNSSLHPFLTVRAEQETDAPSVNGFHGRTRNNDWLLPYENRTVRLRCLPGATNFGDSFRLNSPALGAHAFGKSPLFGDVEIQFGNAEGLHLPYALSFKALSPLFRKKMKSLLTLYPPGSEPGLIGMRGVLDFEHHRYLQTELSLTSDPQKLSVGAVPMAGETPRHEIVLRKFLFVDVMRKLLCAEPRTPTDSFAYLTSANFALSPRGFLVYSAAGSVHVPYPAGYRFPLPSGKRTEVQENSSLTPFVNVKAVDPEAFVPAAAASGEVGGMQVERGCVRDVQVEFSSRSAHRFHWRLRIDGRSHRGESLDGLKVVEMGDSEVLSTEIVIHGRSNDRLWMFLTRRQGAFTEALCFSLSEKFDFWISAAH